MAKCKKNNIHNKGRVEHAYIVKMLNFFLRHQNTGTAGGKQSTKIDVVTGRGKVIYITYIN